MAAQRRPGPVRVCLIPRARGNQRFQSEPTTPTLRGSAPEPPAATHPIASAVLPLVFGTAGARVRKTGGRCRKSSKTNGTTGATSHNQWRAATSPKGNTACTQWGGVASAPSTCPRTLAGGQAERRAPRHHDRGGDGAPAAEEPGERRRDQLVAHDAAHAQPLALRTAFPGDIGPLLAQPSQVT
eukprot:1188508-Prorocentrum_minimum.AAC.1